MKRIPMAGGKRMVSGFVPALILILFSSFQSFIEQNVQIEGKWTALWQIKDFNSTGAKEEMKGIMNFKSNGLVEIVAYGHPGCIFGSDTLKNELKWTINNDSLQLYNPKDQFNLTYIIENYDRDEVLLKLMDDIRVTLKR